MAGINLVKKVKTIGTLILVIVIGLGINNKALASTFDPAYYAARYPDVVNALGTDSVALYNHYVTNGIYEGRYANASDEANGIAGAPVNDVVPAFSTYVDINIDAQTLTYYKDNQIVLQSSIVTGNVSKGRSTPKGIFEIYSKVNGKYLTGPTWKNWVDYWMPFNQSIGLHDATWRSEFGGTIYQNSGSHGCVNLPHDVASQLFSMIEQGTIVVVR